MPWPRPYRSRQAMHGQISPFAAVLVLERLLPQCNGLCGRECTARAGARTRAVAGPAGGEHGRLHAEAALWTGPMSARPVGGWDREAGDRGALLELLPGVVIEVADPAGRGNPATATGIVLALRAGSLRRRRRQSPAHADGAWGHGRGHAARRPPLGPPVLLGPLARRRRGGDLRRPAAAMTPRDPLHGSTALVVQAHGARRRTVGVMARPASSARCGRPRAGARPRRRQGWSGRPG
jgi:hypothetical protein